MAKAATKERPTNGEYVVGEIPDLVEEAVLAVDDDEPEEETPEQERARLNKATVSLTFNGETFTIPKRKGRWRMGVHRDLQNGDLDGALIKLIGEQRYAQLDAAGWTWDDFDALATKIGTLINEECVP